MAVADGAREPEPAAPAPDRPAADVEPTVGTGSVFAIGCALLTLLIIFVGIAVIMLM